MFLTLHGQPATAIERRLRYEGQQGDDLVSLRHTGFWESAAEGASHCSRRFRSVVSFAVPQSAHGRGSGMFGS